MPRPEKRTAEYYPMYVKDGRTLSVLQLKHGLAGIGFFTNLMRLLSDTPNHYLNLTDEADRLYTASKIGCDEVEMEGYIDTMIATHKLHKYLWETHRVIYCDDLVKSLVTLYEKRKAKPMEIEEILSEVSGAETTLSGVVSVTETPVKVTETPQRREENTIGKKTCAVAPLKDDLAARWEAAFIAKVPMSAWGDIGRGRRDCGVLAKKLRALSTDTGIAETELASSLIAAFMELKGRGKADFWRTATFTPTGFLARWAEVVDETAREHSEPEETEGGKRFLEGVYGKRD